MFGGLAVGSCCCQEDAFHHQCCCIWSYGDQAARGAQNVDRLEHFLIFVTALNRLLR